MGAFLYMPRSSSQSSPRFTPDEVELVDLLLDACARHCRDYASFLGVVVRAENLTRRPDKPMIRRAYIIMLALELLRETEHDTHFHITEKGLHAAEVGIETYLINREEERAFLRHERNVAIASAIAQTRNDNERIGLEKWGMVFQFVTFMISVFAFVRTCS